MRDTSEALEKVAIDPGGLHEASAAILVPQCTIKVLPIGFDVNHFVSLYQSPLVPPENCSERQRNRVNIGQIRNGSYPYKLEVLSVVVTEDGGDNQRAGEAYANMLLTTQGQRLIQDAGYLPYAFKQRFSQGETVLIKELKSSPKLAAAQAFAKQDYQTAIDQLNESLKQNQNDPEAVIYRSNAELRLTNRPAYRIAVSVPIGTKANVAEEILRGVAQAQAEINQQGGIGGRIGLEVEIVDDDNDPAIGAQVAAELVKDLDLLAIVGHNTGDVSKAAAQIYQANGIVMISPTTFDPRVAAVGDYIFRAVPTAQRMAESLVSYLVSQVSNAKVLICYDSAAPDQDIFRDATEQALGERKLVLTDAQGRNQCDYSSDTFDANSLIDRAIQRGANAIFVGSNVNNFQGTADLIRANNGRLRLFGNATLYTRELLNLTQQAAEGLVVVAPWAPDVDPVFTQRANSLWGATVNWRTAGAYDATQALIAGLAQSNTRAGLRSTLATLGFSVTGAGGPVRFSDSRDRDSQPVVVQVKNGQFESIK